MNINHHSNQSPILKFSPGNCLLFLIILPSADINHFQAIIHHVGHIGFLAIKTCKSKICSFDTLCINYSLKVNKKKTNMTKIEQIGTLSNSCSHILPLDACQVIFTTTHCTMYGSNHLNSEDASCAHEP